MYNSSVRRWKRYEKFLGPMFEALGDLAPVSDTPAPETSRTEL